MNAEPELELALSPDRAVALIEAGAEVIDVRRPDEWEGGRLPGARNIEMNELSAASESLPRDRPILLYCRRGNRSQMAAEAFRGAGYDARTIAGGIEAWAAGGRPLEPAQAAVRPPLPAS